MQGRQRREVRLLKGRALDNDLPYILALRDQNKKAKNEKQKQKQKQKKNRVLRRRTSWRRRAQRS
jgi:hypothetical protein